MPVVFLEQETANAVRIRGFAVAESAASREQLAAALEAKFAVSLDKLAVGAVAVTRILLAPVDYVFAYRDRRASQSIITVTD